MIKIRNKKIEVLVAYTTPEMWDAVEDTKIAVQGQSAKDADYFAFARMGLKENKGRAIITHIAEIGKTKSNVPVEEYIKKFPKLSEYFRKRNWNGFSKEYYLENIRELKNPIYHKIGDKAKGRVRFYTNLNELKNANFMRDIKTLSQLNKR